MKKIENKSEINKYLKNKIVIKKGITNNDVKGSNEFITVTKSGVLKIKK